MIKNIGKFKQWTGEKMGKSHKTRMDEDFHALQAETEAKRVALEKLHESSEAYLKAISKRVEGDDKHKGLAIESFGICMSAQSYTLREGSTYREALLQMGDAHQSIGAAQSELISRFGSSYIECLERAQAQMKEYQALQKKLSSRRLDYDAKLAKVQKAKKEKPEWEEEMQAAKAKYEETRECVLAIMTAINESQDENVNSLKAYYDAQLAFARRMVVVLEAIPESTFVIPHNESRASPYTDLQRRNCRDSSFESEREHSIYSDDQSSGHSIPSTAGMQRQKQQDSDLSRSTSHTTYTAAHVRKNSIDVRKHVSVAVQGPPAPPPEVAGRSRHQKQVKALYNFEATAEGELSLRKGDIVRIIEEIDEGWWEGEMVDPHGVRHEGMFPSNYVEVVAHCAGPQQPHQALKSNSPEPTRYMDEDEAAYYERASETTNQYEDMAPAAPELAAQVSVAKRAPPPPIRQAAAATAIPNAQPSFAAGVQLQSSPVLARATPPPTRPASVISKPVGSRVPPPPPPARRTGADSTRQSAIFSHAPTPPSGSPPSATNCIGSSPPGPGPGAHGMGYIPKDYFLNQAGAGESTDVGPCRECSCTEFTANVFKRESCNNCFHTHTSNRVARA
ncbi:hypothetical protein BGZ68_009829 [Mortierella alpina]|nr:hypothetical protein BGZ68_009829 [Mortierella alpina]